MPTRPSASAPASPPPAPTTTPFGAFGATVERIDLDHIVSVIRKWMLLILGGVVAAVGLSLLIARGNLPAYEAESMLYFDQPRLVTNGAAGRPAVQKLFALVRNYAELIESDQVMVAAQRRLRTSADIETLRARITATPINDTQLLRVTGTDRTRVVAERLTATVNAALVEEIERYQLAADIPELERYKVTTVRSPVGVRPPSNEGRTAVLTAILALIIMIGVAFLLEYIQRDPEAEANLEPAAG